MVNENEEMKDTSFYLRNHRSFLMGLAMLSVMLYHQRWFSGLLFDYFNRLGLLGVDIFLFISGWGIYQSLSKNTLKKYFINRFCRIIPTCVLIGCIEVALRKLGVDSGVDSLFVNCLTVMGLFKWYIYAIICYYTLAPLLFIYVTSNKKICCLILLVVLGSFIVGSLGIESSGKSVFITTIPIILYRATGFLIGFLYARNEFVVPQYYTCFSIISLLIIFVLYFMDVQQWYINIIFFILAPITLPIVVKGLTKVIPFFKAIGVYSMISSIGIMSLDYYLWHEYLYIGWSNSGCFESNFITCIAALLSTVLLSNITYFVIANIRKT